MKMNGIIRTLLVGGVCLASVACSSKKSAEAATEPVVEVKPKVTTAVVHIEDVDQQSVFTGNVEGRTVLQLCNGSCEVRQARKDNAGKRCIQRLCPPLGLADASEEVRRRNV